MGSKSKEKPDRWIKCVSTQSNIRGVAVHATHLVRHAAGLHSVKGRGAQGLGEALVGGLLVGSYCKAGERVNLNIQGSGYFKQALVDAYPDGAVRGYVTERSEEITEAGLGRDEKGPWGSGLLALLRTKGEPGKQPYIGTVPLVTGHLAKDLTFYWMQSEQIPSAVGIVSEISKKGEIAIAGGFLVQALPGASPAEIQLIEKQIQNFDELGSEMLRNPDPIHLLSRIFQDSSFAVVEERELSFRCTCSWERVERALSLVGVAELRAMLAEDHHASVRCDFCSKEYQVTAEVLESMIKALKN